MSQNDEGAVETKEEQTSTEQAATQEANEPVETNNVDETTADEAGSQETNEPEIDYEAELRRVEEEKNNWKQAALNAKDKLKRKSKGEEPSEEQSEDDDSALEIIKRTVQETVESTMAPLRSELLGNTIDETLSGLTNDSAEQKLIRFHYENTINKTGLDRSAIARDLANAHAVANAARIRKENSELKTAMKNRAGMRNTSMGSNQTPAASEVDVSNLKFSATELAVIEQAARRSEISVADYIKQNAAKLKT
jgi:hypothetical protein